MNNFNILILFTLCIFLNWLVIKYKYFFERISSEYNAVQKIHAGFTPRIGGMVVIFVYYLSLFFLNKNSIFFDYPVLLSAVLILFFSFIEDIFGNIKAKIRFLAILIASFIFIYSRENLPIIDIPVIDKILLEYPIVNIIFFSLGLSALINGFNMIDGMNGLAGLTGLACTFSIFSLMIFILNEVTFEVELLTLVICLVVFLFFNFPLGKIFLGDSGAYFLGWVLGIFIIELYNDNRLNTWGALLIIFYPLQEVFFSFFRKILQNKSPLKSDTDHLHLKLFFHLKGLHTRGRYFNSFVTVCLMPFWFLPSFLIIWTQLNSHFTFFFLFILEAAYLFYYYSIPKKK